MTSAARPIADAGRGRSPPPQIRAGGFPHSLLTVFLLTAATVAFLATSKHGKRQNVENPLLD
jgi:hypothetical protein